MQNEHVKDPNDPKEKIGEEPIASVNAGDKETTQVEPSAVTEEIWPENPCDCGAI